MSFSSIGSNLLTLIEPWAIMTLSAALIPFTAIHLIFLGNLRTLCTLSDFSDELFARAWIFIGPIAKSRAQKLVVPLLEGRVFRGKIHDEPVSPALQGVVLEVGAGTGEWVDVLARICAEEERSAVVQDRSGDARLNGARGITKIYGIEPNAQSAAVLSQRVRKFGLSEVYEVVPVGIESVTDPSAWNGKIKPGSVDCIVCIRCMCSIPEPEKNIALLYRLLKPGGRWYVFEHVKTARGVPFIPFYQSK
ncbi:hypothetical protein MY8738_010164 [Beauveria namnaoensis]